MRIVWCVVAVILLAPVSSSVAATAHAKAPATVVAASKSSSARSANASSPAWPPGAEVVPFELRDGLMLVRTTIRGPERSVTGWLVFDTGSPGLGLKASLPTQLGLETREIEMGRVRVERHPIESLEIGSARITTPPFDVGLSDSLFGPEVLGLFGPDALGDRAVIVDYDRRELAIVSHGAATVTLDTTAVARGAAIGTRDAIRRSRVHYGSGLPAGAVPVPCRIYKGGRILVTARIDDPSQSWSSRPLTLMLDTGASACVLFDDAVAERVSRMRSWPRLPGVRVRTVSGDTLWELSLLPRLTLTGALPPLSSDRIEAGVQSRAAFPDIQSELPDAVHGLLGFTFLRRYRFVMDYSNEVLWLEPLPEHETAAHANAGVGLQLEQRWGLVRVASVAKGSSAAESGIVFGEVVVSIDGVTTEDAVAEDAQKLLDGEPGTEVVLVVRRDGTDRVLKLKRRAER